MAGEPRAGDVGRQIGRYVLYDEIAVGGMATIHLGRLVGAVGFSRTVAIKRLHPQYAKDPDFVAMFMDEARLAARVRHPNVVPTLDVVARDGELFLVMEYVQGESLSRLVRKCTARGEPPPAPIVAWIVAGILHGLHAAHEAKNEQGESLHIVHRDVSPQNVIVGVDGIPRLLDFGVAHARQRSQTTQDGQVKGKLAYMAPEQLQRDDIDRRSDVYAAGVVLWEALTGQRLFQGASEGRLIALVLQGDIRPPSEVAPALGTAFDAICLKALATEPDGRYQTARAMALDVEEAVRMATPSAVGTWVESLAGDVLAGRAGRIADIESRSDVFAALGGPTPYKEWTPGSPPAAGIPDTRSDAPAAPAAGPQASVTDPAPAPVSMTDPAPAPVSVTDPAPAMTAVTVVAPGFAATSASAPVAAAAPSVPSWPSVPTASGISPVRPQLPTAPVEAPPEFRPSRKKIALVAGAAAGALLVLVGVVAIATSGGDKAPAPTPTATADVPAAATATAPPPAAATIASPIPATATPSARATASAKPTATARPTAHPVAVDPCKVPYTVDARGVKHPKPECL